MFLNFSENTLLKHLLLSPEKLSCLIFSLSDDKSYYVQATPQQRARRALPEEIIRQLFVLSLIHDYKYPEGRIRLEWPIQMGRDKKRADIVVLDESGNVLIILEIKVETDQHSMGQLKSYMAITGAKYGALISASEMMCIEMLSARDVTSVRDIPLFDVTTPRHNILTRTATAVPAFLNEGTMQTENADKSHQEFPLQQLTGIEKFERVSKIHANITIKGRTLRLPIEEIDSYKTLRKRFLNEGIVLNPKVKQSEWFALLSHLLDSNPVPEQKIIENLGPAGEEVMKAIKQGLPGFAGGWVSSSALDRLIKTKRIEKLMPRTKRREMMKSLGYDWHPGLRGGRTTVNLPDTSDRPVLFVKRGHEAINLNDNKDIVKAYLVAQQSGASEPDVSVASR